MPGPYLDVDGARDSRGFAGADHVGRSRFAYLMPFLEPRARVIAPASNFTDPRFGNRLQREMAVLIADAPRPDVRASLSRHK